MSFKLSDNKLSTLGMRELSPELKFGKARDRFGSRDFILIKAFDQTGAVLGTRKIWQSSVVGDNFEINLAEIINSFGILTGNISLEYYFLRTEAGSYKSVLLDSESIVYRGRPIKRKGGLYKSTISAPKADKDFLLNQEEEIQNVDVGGERVFSKKLCYNIAGISPDRTEIKVRMKPDDLLKGNAYYKGRFSGFGSDIDDRLILSSQQISYKSLGLDSSVIEAVEDNTMASSTQLINFIEKARSFENKILVEIPDFFLISTTEKEVRTTTKEYFKEDKPTHIPTITQSSESEGKQWVFARDYTGNTEGEWVSNAEGIEFTGDGNVIWSNNLVSGMPLTIASNRDLHSEHSNEDITTSLITAMPTTDPITTWTVTNDGSTTTGQQSDYNNYADYSGQQDDDYGNYGQSGDSEEEVYIIAFSWSSPFRSWFDNNANGKFQHHLYGNALMSNVQLFNYIADKLDQQFIEYIDGERAIPATELDIDLNECMMNMMEEYVYLDASQDSPTYWRDVTTTEMVTTTEYEPFIGEFQNYSLNRGDGDKVRSLSSKITPQEFAEKYNITYEDINDNINKIRLISRKRDTRDLSYYAVTGNSSLNLVINKDYGKDTGLMLVKFLNPLPFGTGIGQDIFFVREVISPHFCDVNLVNYTDPVIPTSILRLPTGVGGGMEPAIRERQTEYQSYDDLLLVSSSQAKEIERDIISGSINEVRLNLDYSNPDNFIKFSSARRRLENFKTKLEKLELYDAYSQSIAGTYYDTGYLGNAANTVIQNAGTDAKRWENASSEVINSFDGYERYLYFDSSSYSSGSAGLFYDASWPKQNSTKPYTLYEVSSSQGVDWYNLNHTSSSTYDRDNIDRLVYHLPDHMRDDSANEEFLKFMDMTGHHFDNLKNYLDRFGQTYEIDESLDKGLSKQLVYSVAKSFGWNLQGGYDLAKLDKYFFGKSVDPVNKSTSIYASASLQDISREVWKRIIANMPFFLKSKGTVESLRGLINCYGIPSTILRVREYGGPTITEVEPIYETSRKFTKALDFKTAQYVSGSWSHSLGLGGTQVPNTIEFRYKAASSSDQTLVQGGNGATGDQFGIYLKDNASADNIGRLSFTLSGSAGYVTSSTEPLPLYNGDFWSVMLTKQVISEDLLAKNNFETGSFQLPFNVWQNGVGVIASASDEVYNGNYSMKVTQNNPGYRTYSAPFQNFDGTVNVWGDARFITASRSDQFDFSVYAKVSGSGGVTARLVVLELDSDGRIINDVPVKYPNTNTLPDPGSGGYHYIDKSITTNWEKISFRPTLLQPSTANISLQLSFTQPKDAPRRSVYFDNGTFNRYFPSTESGNNVNYNLVAKQYDAGRDVIQYESETNLFMPGDENAASQSYNTAYNNTGSLYIGGYTTKDFGGQFSGSMMEFRLWKSRLNVKSFDAHVENPQSYVGNSLSASFEDIALRYSFNESKNHNSDTSVRDTSTDQSTPIAGIATGFADETSYSNVVDRTKFPLPKIGGIRRNANKVRIETAEYLDRIGENINLSPTERVEVSSFDRSPLDSNKIGVYFSPIDVINQDIINQLADFNFDQYLGDARDDTEYQYRDLEAVKLEYFKKYTGANNFWDYMRLLNYFDHSLFTQLESLLPARSQAVVGVLVENNILDRNKQAINHPVFENPLFEDTIKLKDVDSDIVSQSAENNYYEVTQNVTRLDREMDEDSTYEFHSDNQYHESTISGDIFSKPSMRDFNRVDGFGHFGRNYTTSSITYGGPTGVFTESINMINNQRVSIFNKKPSYTYSSKKNFLVGSASAVSFVTSSFEKLTENSTGLRRINFEGSKNTDTTALSTLDVNGKKDYSPVTYILTNPYALVSDARESVQLRTEFDTEGNEQQ